LTFAPFVIKITSVNKRGFTLIELLIVVSILGILAVIALVMNPLEQIQRSKDVAVIMTAEQTYTAFQRSQSFNQFPLSTSYTGVQLASEEGQEILDKLESTKEIKSSFSNREQMDDVYLTYNEPEDKMILCFKLKSNAYKTPFYSTYTSDGQLQENCTPGTCFACLFDEEYQPIPSVEPSSSPTPSPSPSPSFSPSPTPIQATGWLRADTSNNCNEFCATKSLTCSNTPSSCPAYCGSTSGYAQIEATWATWYSSPIDPVTKETCWGSGSCSTSFQWKPLWAYNARCCCK